MKHIKNDKNYHGLVTTLERNDPRIPLFVSQYEERGFDDTETWSLYSGITSYILPRLKRYREIAVGYPIKIGSLDEWASIVDAMILAFELLKISDDTQLSEEQEQLINKGLLLFANNFRMLWS